jgi:hypothetical protein
MSLVTITAQNMLYAQGAKLGAKERAILKTRADRRRLEFDETCKQGISVEVHDFDGALIGYMTYYL